MKGFERIERTNLSEEVAMNIEQAILGGSLHIGSRLPSEQDLSRQFGVSRNIVREGLKLLSERGLIEIITGSGAYVTQPNTAIPSKTLGRYLRLTGTFSSIEFLYEARGILEERNAYLAAERADEQDIELMDASLVRMRAHGGSVYKWREADMDFHLNIAKATHNPFLPVLLEPLVGYVRDVISKGYMAPGGIEKGLRTHDEIYQRIKARDSSGAAKAMKEHLRNSSMDYQQKTAEDKKDPKSSPAG